MSQVRKNHYITTGSPVGHKDYFGVRGSVYLPDAQAGTGHETWYQGEPAREEKEPFRLTAKRGTILLGALIIGCLVYLSVLFGHYNSELNRKAAVMAEIERARALQPSLVFQVQTARDESRIGYLAANRLGMSAADDATTFSVYVSEINDFLGTVVRPASAEIKTAQTGYAAVSRTY